ncbi:MAG: tRNA pseudouridine(38-40) synthase TruA [Coleofasciculaceae cyanobacterium SM2_3_26]|nr:tRNA pseudouridine(38-40) synthase TruA [Coleofasciculaceae cyanobacterium SM2_3_26]
MQHQAQRVAIAVQYQGTYFHGWQRQPHQRTVQEEIERSLQTILGKHTTVCAAGRTDAGVHAAAQVAHFEVDSPIPPHKWSGVLNGVLPGDVHILASAAVAPRWHARFSALWRRYRYTIYTEARPNVFVQPFSWHYYHAPLDVEVMHSALTSLLGTHHLAAFHRARSSRDHSWVQVQEVRCDREGSFLYVEVQANAFLYGMMRLLVGLLVDVGCGKCSLDKFLDIWQAERRDRVKYAAPPQGLCLLRVGYPVSPFPPEIWQNAMPKFVLSL